LLVAKILIVDDDTATASRIAQELTGAGHACAVQSSGRDVVDIAKKESLDLIVIEAMLPDVSGFEVCRRIRSDATLFTLPVLFLSAMGSPEEIQHGLEQGADDYVTKPCDPRQFSQRVEALLRSSATEDYIDHLTELPDAAGSRKRIQSFITRKRAFAVVYAEVLNLRGFSTRQNEAGRNKVLRHVARALKGCGENFRDPEFMVGHLGGGYFICVVPAGEARTYCTKVQRSWRNHIKSLYASLHTSHRTEESASPDPLDLLLCVTSRKKNEPVSAQHILDTLSRIRRTVGDVTVGSIHMDRRLS